MLRGPLYATDFDRGWGTLFTAAYRPREGRMELAWPDGTWSLAFDDFPERTRVVRYG